MTLLLPNFAIATLALLIENLVGYPNFIYDRIGHPVEWMGRLLQKLESVFYQDHIDATENRRKGILIILVLCIVVALPALALQLLLSDIPYGWLFNALLATPLLAQKSLRDHVDAVANALTLTLPDARREVAKIVGRNTGELDESAISKAALESLAENTSDGIVAPALWFAIAGLPGLVVYKAINTADSMIGHKTERYLHFGWATAKLDDLVNLPASRLTGCLFILAAAMTSKNNCQSAWATMLRDAVKHNSPNAGWPEAAMAGALGLRFGGPRNYTDGEIDLPWMGDGRTEMSQTDIRAGLKLYDRSLILLAGVFAFLAIFL